MHRKEAMNKEQGAFLSPRPGKYFPWPRVLSLTGAMILVWYWEKTGQMAQGPAVGTLILGAFLLGRTRFFCQERAHIVHKQKGEL